MRGLRSIMEAERTGKMGIAGTSMSDPEGRSAEVGAPGKKDGESGFDDALTKACKLTDALNRANFAAARRYCVNAFKI